MENSDSTVVGGPPSPWLSGYRHRYEEQMQAMRATFAGHAQHLHAGAAALQARSAAVDAMVQGMWTEILAAEPGLAGGVALVGVGGYGRRELFPFSDVDLMFLLDERMAERTVKEPIRHLNQMLWDSGLRVAAMTRTLVECERFDRENVEFTLSLLDARGVAGDSSLSERLLEKSIPKVLTRDGKKIAARLLEVTRARRARYGDTLFHLEPNIKECPGGLRDAHVCNWLARLGGAGGELAASLRAEAEFIEAREFLLLVRVFLHLRHGRDDNTLDWQAQDQAAAEALGTGRRRSGATAEKSMGKEGLDAAYWMRLYFRHARVIERAAAQLLDESGPTARLRSRPLALQGRAAGKRLEDAAPVRYEVRQNRVWFSAEASEPSGERVVNPAHDPEIVLSVFAAMAKSGVRLANETERRIEQALPFLSAHLEDGPHLWQRLKAILIGKYAGAALRAMHALGILELVIPEFHGIDALVIRDAYHRYTVDEHTFVLIDTLHGLGQRADESLAGWTAKFEQLFRDLPHPELLLLASLMHDTGKGHATQGHALESARMAGNLMKRLELDGYEQGLMLDLIRNHLEMSAALRRDVFDQETIRSFAERVANPEALRMLTLFTYADITAVHPDALTAWKAENLWRLFNATVAYLDRNVDDERVASQSDLESSELLLRIHALLPHATAAVNGYLRGFPRRYLQTRSPELVRTHLEMAWRLEELRSGVELAFRYAPGGSELTLVTRDRPRLFATMAGALAGWGMNIVTADAFSNAEGVVVDSFRFTDTFRTLEMNDSERDRFVASMRDLIKGDADLEALLASRRRGRKKPHKTRVDSRIDFDDEASSHSTLLQAVAQDNPGLLHALSLTLAEQGCNIEVALVDTEGEMAIDVFYVTGGGNKLDKSQQESLRTALLEAIEGNVR